MNSQEKIIQYAIGQRQRRGKDQNGEIAGLRFDQPGIMPQMREDPRPGQRQRPEK